jgi:hypothetical protein
LGWAVFCQLGVTGAHLPPSAASPTPPSRGCSPGVASGRARAPPSLRGRPRSLRQRFGCGAFLSVGRGVLNRTHPRARARYPQSDRGRPLSWRVSVGICASAARQHRDLAPPSSLGSVPWSCTTATHHREPSASRMHRQTDRQTDRQTGGRTTTDLRRVGDRRRGGAHHHPYVVLVWDVGRARPADHPAAAAAAAAVRAFRRTSHPAKSVAVVSAYWHAVQAMPQARRPNPREERTHLSRPRSRRRPRGRRTASAACRRCTPYGRTGAGGDNDKIQKRR